MHTVVLGLDERVLDVSDSFSTLRLDTQLWLIEHVGPNGYDGGWWLDYDHKDPNTGYVIHFLSESDAIRFKLTWM
jgi:hypothetical protein